MLRIGPVGQSVAACYMSGSFVLYSLDLENMNKC